ncbi:hypothetical protein; putative membrane protein [Bradyrhizobium sp. ORS 278]|nr:hypothetical protein; putative membrane protein [Bradyrhizobium sp. ORS 278]
MLCTFLRERGLRLGTGEALRVSAVLDELGRRGTKPRTAQEATRWLAPLVCTNAAQQAVLPLLLAEFESLFIPAPVPPAPLPTLPPAEQDPAGAGANLMKNPFVAGAILLGMIGLFVALAYALGFRVSPDPPPVSDPRTAVQPLTRDFSWLWMRLSQGLSFAIVPIGFWLMFYSWYRRRPVVLQRARTRDAPDEKARHSLAESSADRFVLFGAPELRRPLQAMRAHRLAPSAGYDFAQSACATAKAGGFLTLVQDLRPMLPEYPVLIEQLSGKDHVAALGRALAARLTAERLAATVYVFSTDPRMLRGDTRRLLGLGDVLSRHGDDTILLVSDGDVLIDPLTGAANAYALELLAWANPVLLTPVPLARWSRREQVLAEAGLLVMPATPEGLAQLALKLAGNAELQSPALRLPAAQCRAVRRDIHASLAWHHDEPIPAPEEREEIIDAIAAELPAAAFELLCVLARFPDVRLDLTLHMGLMLKRRNGDPLLDEESFGALAWLPWMRLGRLPDWLRLDLVQCLSAKRREEARQLYDLWLAQGLPQQGGDDTPIAYEPGAFARLLRRHVASDPSTPLRDVIFLKSQRGEEISDIDLRAPDVLRRLLRPGFLDPEWIAGAVALGLAVLAFVYAPELVALRKTRTIDGVPGAISIVAGSAASIITWHLAAYLERWRAWLTITNVVSVLLLLVTQAIVIVDVAPNDLFRAAMASLLLPGFVLALVPAKIEPLDQLLPFRDLSTFLYLLAGVLYAVVMIDVANKSTDGILVAAIGVTLLAAILSNIVNLPLVFMLIGAILGGIFSYFPAVAVVLLLQWLVRPGDFENVLSLQSWVHIGIITAVYGAMLAAVTLRRIRLTRFLIIAALGIVGILVATIANAMFDVPSAPSRAPQHLTPLRLWSSYVPSGGLCLVLTLLALVRPDALTSRPVVRGGLVYMVTVFAAGLLIGVLSDSSPNDFASSNYRMFSVPVRQIGAAIGHAVQFLFVPGAIAAIMAALANAEARQNGASASASPWRAFAAVYAPPLWLVAIPPLGLLTVQGALFGTTFGAPLLFIPAAAALGSHFGTASWPAVIIGGLPFFLYLDFAPLKTIASPGIFLTALLVHRLFADPTFRTRVLFATSLAPIQLTAIILLLGSTYQFAIGSDPSGSGSAELALYYVLFLLGASRIPKVPVTGVLLAVAVVTFAVNFSVDRLIGTNPMSAVEWPVYLTLGFTHPSEITTPLAFLLLGGYLFHWQLPRALQREESRNGETANVASALAGVLLLCVVLSHAELRGSSLGRTAFDGLIGAAVFQPLIFMLGMALGWRGVLLSAAILLGGEFLPALLSGSGKLALAFNVWDLKVAMSYPRPIDVLTSRFDDLAFALFGWRVMLAFRPSVASGAVDARAEAPMPKAA